jgi:hypothetical protein
MKVFFLFGIIIFSIPVFAQEADTALSPETVPVESDLSGGTDLPAERRPAREEFLSAPPQRGELWVSPGAETAFFTSSGISVGGSFALAYGSRASMGFKATWFSGMNNELDALELNFLLRFYFLGSAAAGTPSGGPYLQLTGGPALFFNKAEDISIPAKWGTVSAGLTFGWRFLFGKFIFVEPYIRGGYPYIAGAGVSAGLRF